MKAGNCSFNPNTALMGGCQLVRWRGILCKTIRSWTVGKCGKNGAYLLDDIHFFRLSSHSLEGFSFKIINISKL